MTTAARGLAALAVLLAAPLCASCTQDAGAPSGKMERTQAVKAAAGARTPESFCDKAHAASIAPSLALPPVTALPSGKTERLSTSGRWAWINLWATFCVPCLREMDALVKWQAQIAQAGTPLDLVFVSVDEGAAEVREWLAKNRKVAALPHYFAGDRAALEAAIKPLGLGSLDSIPMHILVAPDGKVRCVRAGALNDDDFPLVRRLVQ